MENYLVRYFKDYHFLQWEYDFSLLQYVFYQVPTDVADNYWYYNMNHLSGSMQFIGLHDFEFYSGWFNYLAFDAFSAYFFLDFSQFMFEYTTTTSITNILAILGVIEWTLIIVLEI